MPAKKKGGRGAQKKKKKKTTKKKRKQNQEIVGCLPKGAVHMCASAELLAGYLKDVASRDAKSDGENESLKYFLDAKTGKMCD